MFNDRDSIMNEIQRQYDCLVEEGHIVFGVFLHGSQNYGLSTDESDLDTRAIIIPSMVDFALNNTPINKCFNIEGVGECTMKDVRNFVLCLKNQSIDWLELLVTDYYVLNPEYKDFYFHMRESVDKIARSNQFAAINCMVGIAEHAYRRFKSKEDSYMKGKMAVHVLRMSDALSKYKEGRYFKEVLQPYNSNLLLAIKKEEISMQDITSLVEGTYSWLLYNKNNLIEDKYLATEIANKDLLNVILINIIEKTTKEQLKIN